MKFMKERPGNLNIFPRNCMAQGKMSKHHKIYGKLNDTSLLNPQRTISFQLFKHSTALKT